MTVTHDQNKMLCKEVAQIVQIVQNVFALTQKQSVFTKANKNIVL